jgi:transcriptional regulator with XRE-family HTH domain
MPSNQFYYRRNGAEWRVASRSGDKRGGRVRLASQSAVLPAAAEDRVTEEGASLHRLPLAGGDTPASVGQELQRARQAAGLSLEDVAARTKVRPGILAQIEADAHDRLPALTYTLGFLKAYARTVGLDPEAVAARYRRESQKGDPVPSFVELEPLEERRLPSRGLLIASLLAGLLLLLGLLVWALVPDPLPETPAGSAPAAAPTPATPTAVAAPATSGAQVPAPADAPVRLTALDDVWIRVRDTASGDRLFEGVLAKGQTFDVPPGRALVLRAGRAGALQVSIGGEQLPPLGGLAEVLAAQPLDAAALRTRATPRGGLSDGPPPVAGGPAAAGPPPSGLTEAPARPGP